MCPPTFLEIAVVTLENNASQKIFFVMPPPPPPPRYNFLPTVVTNFIKLKTLKAVIVNMDKKEPDKATQLL